MFPVSRFNACSGSLEETKEICRALAWIVVLPYANEKDEDFFKMASALREGITCMVPTQSAALTVHYAYYLTKTTCLSDLKDTDAAITENIVMLNSFSEKIVFAFHKILYKSLQFNVFRVLVNCIASVALWLQPRFPFMAYLMFGFSSCRFLSFRYYT